MGEEPVDPYRDWDTMRPNNFGNWPPDWERWCDAVLALCPEPFSGEKLDGSYSFKVRGKVAVKMTLSGGYPSLVLIGFSPEVGMPDARAYAERISDDVEGRMFGVIKKQFEPFWFAAADTSREPQYAATVITEFLQKAQFPPFQGDIEQLS